MPVNALEPTDQRFVSELPSYIRESRALLNQVEILAEADAINIENAVNVGSAYNVENADVVDTAENIETATNVTNATTIENAETVTNSVGDITTVQAVENNTGDITNAVTVRNADLVTNAELVTGAIAAVTTVEQATNCTITHADVVNDFGGVTASAAEINTACDGDTAKNNHTHQLVDGADDVTLLAAEINGLPGDITTVQNNLTTHAGLTNPHSATSLATPERIPLRDANGNFAVGNALDDADAMNRTTCDGRFGQYSSGSAAAGGNFTAGTISWIKIGSVVVVSWSGLTHNSSAGPVSDSVIPAAFRPAATQYNTFYTVSSNYVSGAYVQVGGSLAIVHREWDGTNSNQTAVVNGSITYVV